MYCLCVLYNKKEFWEHSLAYSSVKTNSLLIMFFINVAQQNFKKLWSNFSEFLKWTHLRRNCSKEMVNNPELNLHFSQALLKSVNVKKDHHIAEMKISTLFIPCLFPFPI